MSVWQHKRGGWYLGLRWPGQKQLQIYLGAISEDQARYIDARVLELQRSRPLGVPLSVETTIWMNKLTGSLYDALLKLGLVDARAVKLSMTLGQWCEAYLKDRKDYAKGTIKGWNTAKTHMNSAFPTIKMHEITAYQAEQFARDLLTRASSEHASKIVERINQLYEAAIKAEMLARNPFSDVKITGKPDKERQFYLTSQASDAILSACLHEHAAALFALARWCGLRVPHEPLALKWEHIDWEQLRLSVPCDTKTGFRVLPLFPKAVEPMRKLRAVTPMDQEHVFDRARKSAATTWRNWLEDAIAKASLHGWPKLWHNLRASCRTDLEDLFESHVCDAWLGHSHRVAKDHYLMVTPADWEKARG